MRRLIAFVSFASALAGCDSPSIAPTEARPLAGAFQLVVSDTAASPRGIVAVRLAIRTDVELAGVRGTLGFDPSRLRYLGQPGPVGPFTIVNDMEEATGRLRIASLAVPTLGAEAGTFLFEVTGPEYHSSLWYQVDEAATSNGPIRVQAGAVRGSETSARVDAAAPPRRLTVADWAAVAGVAAPAAGPARVPGAATLFGDVTLDGFINIVDAYAAANLSVGNLPLITDASKDQVVAANVFPFNLPGLGEAGDPAPPGVEVDGSRIVTILDAVAIANDGVGNDQPIVREAIPGRQPAAGRAVLTGSLTASRTLSRDTVYELQGIVKVTGGTVLTIPPGTRLEGDPASRGTLMVLRGGRVEASGTFLEPIVMTCAAAVPTPGCWGGVVLNGLALINNDVSGPGGIVVCPEKQTIGSTEMYGGCLVDNASGTLRFVRIEYGGQFAGNGPTPGLALLGTGFGTVVDFVQVHGSAGSGIFVSGGTVNVGHVLVTGSAGAGLAWDDGWLGLGQFLVIQQPATGGPGLLGSNYGQNPNAGPRSKPQLYHATILGAGAAPATAGIALVAGSGVVLRSAIVAGFGGAGFDVADPATCALAGTPALILEATIFHGNGEPFATDSDCLDEHAFGTDPARGNLLVDPALVAPFNTLTLDIRPTPGSPAASGAPAAPSDPFFDGLATYFGASAAATAQGNRIPWFTGWSRGWTGTP